MDSTTRSRLRLVLLLSAFLLLGAEGKPCAAPELACKTDGECPSGEFCLHGTCTAPSDCICPHVWEPVCGTDGQTYGNACEAGCAGVDVGHAGSCEPACPVRFCETHCRFGPEIDADGCPTCGCNEELCESDADCAADARCSLEVCVNTCVDGDPFCLDACVGTCVPDRCVCPDVWAPVCGVDGVTYGNACEARCAGVSVRHEGECRDACRGNGDCPAGEICYPPTATCQPACAIDCFVPAPVCGEDGVTYLCGELDAHCNGAEVVHPGSCGCACPDIWDPVCGVDGVTYANACEAQCAGVAPAAPGECGGACEPVFCDLFCEFGHETGPDGCPTCACKEPCICTQEYQPVCGADGQTYSNGCFAECAGVDVVRDGECLRHCESNADCAEGLVCHPESKACQPPCDVSCFRYDPVCGTDGVTYACGEDDAFCNGAEVVHEGECGGPGIEGRVGDLVDVDRGRVQPPGELPLDVLGNAQGPASARR